MGAMLKEAVSRSGVGLPACVVLVAVAALFAAIAVWAMRSNSKAVFESASRLPFHDEE